MSADGNWKVTINSPMGVQTGTLSVKTSGDSFTGTFAGQQGNREEGPRLHASWLLLLQQP